MSGRDDDLDVAIVGMSCRFPGAPDVDAYWRNLLERRDSVSRFTAAQLLEAGVSREEAHDPLYVPCRGVLDGIERFDSDYFACSPAEAAMLDPQQRVFLELAVEAFEAAGMDPARATGGVGIYAGQSLSTYLIEILLRDKAFMRRSSAWEVGMSNEKDMLSMRTAYKLGTTGPAVTVQTACSTSLVAVHLAVQALLNGECAVALAGGVTISVPQTRGYRFEPDGILAPDGRCRPFDAAAAGTVFGNGAGAVVLMRLADALAGRHPIRAVIKGTAVNNDGHRKAGFTAPSIDGQVEVVRAALRMAGLAPADIGYVEAHGTGTAVGDPIELAALETVFDGVAEGACLVGSVKGNVGHLDNAAGIAGLIKAAMAVETGRIPATLHFATLNPRAVRPRSAFRFSGATEDWRTPGLRRAGLSSFGIGGTNAHVVLEEPPAMVRPSHRPLPAGGHALLLSAASEEALRPMRERLARALEADPSIEMRDVAHTLDAGRRALPWRWGAHVLDRQDALEALRSSRPAGHPTDRPRVVFMFPGQGSQYDAMTASLYEMDGPYRESLDECAAHALALTGRDLREALFARAGAAQARDAVAVQLGLFAVELSLARSWMHRGVTPDAVIGHSLGEYAAACVAGVLSLEQAIRFVELRARLMQTTPPGAMLVVELPLQEVETYTEPGKVETAAVNAPSQVVLAGYPAAVSAVEAKLAARGVASLRLAATVGFHSPTLDGIVAAFEALIAPEQLSAPRIPMISNLTGRWMADDRPPPPAYWARHLREAVLFGDGLAGSTLGRRTVFLEVGPGRTLCGLLAARSDMPTGTIGIPSLPARGGEPHEAQGMGAARIELWQSGITVGWRENTEVPDAARVRLPAYPFQRRRHWIDGPPRPADAVPDAAARVAASGARGAVAYEPVWERALPASSDGAQAGRQIWLLVGGDADLADALARIADQSGVLCERWSPHSGLAGALTDVAHRLGAAPDRLVCLGATLHLAVEVLSAWQSAFGETKVTLDIVTRGSVSVAGECVPDPFATMLTALERVAAREFPHVRCRTTDVSPAAGTGEQACARELFERLRSADVEGFIALRGRTRWARRFRELAPSPAKGTGLRQGGVYIVTGGFGDAGVALAEALAAKASARLALIGRRDPLASGAGSAPQASAADRVRRLLDGGIEIATFSCDVADKRRLHEVIAQVLERFGRIDGVFHAAGVGAGTLLHDGTPAAAASTLSPKVDGTLALELALSSTTLDFLVLFSSTAAYDGLEGQGYYAAANAFLNGFANSRMDRAPHRVLSVAWGPWHAGMSLRARERLAAWGRPLDHPVLTRVAEGLHGETIAWGELRADDHWLLNEHRVGDLCVLPGTAWLELACVAVADAGACVRLEDVRFLVPLRLPPGGVSPVVVAMEPAGGRSRRFTILATPQGSASLVVCAEGLMETAAPRSQERAGQAAEADRWPRIDIAERIVPSLQGISLGPRWSCIRSCTGLTDRWEVALELPADLAGDLAHHPFHPALVDAAWAPARLVAGRNMLPHTVGRFEFLRPLTRTLRARSRLVNEGGDALDVEIFDDSGALALKISGASFVEVTRESLARFERPPVAAPEGRDVPAGSALRRSLSALGLDSQASMAPADAIEALFRVLEETSATEVVITADAAAMDALNRPVDSAAADAAPAVASGPRGSGRGDLASSLAAVFADVLATPDLGPDDNFFTGGGDSLKAIRVVGRAKELGVAFTVAALFQHPTGRALAAYLESHQATGSEAAKSVKPLDLLPAHERERVPAGAVDVYPLAALQAGAVFHRQHAPGDAIYHDVLLVHFIARWEPHLLQKALHWVVAGHDILRTSFDFHTFAEPMQVVWQSVQPQLRLADLSGQADPGSALEQWTAAELAQPIDSSSAPLFRCYALRMAEDAHVLALSIDDAILDGWSAASLATHVLAAYDTLLAHEPLQARTRAGGLSYSAFVAAERAAAADADQTRFWREVAGRCVATRLPRRADAAGGHRVRTHKVLLSPTGAMGAAALARSWGRPVKELLLAVHMRVLALVAGEPDVTTGLETNGRLEDAGGELTLGLHLNTVPLALRLRSGSWRELVEQVASAEQDLMPRRRFPLAHILRLHRSGPMFEAVFNFTHFHVYQHAGMEHVRIADVSGHGQTHYVLRTEFNVDHASGAVRLFLEFNERELDPAFIEGLGRCYDEALSRLVEAPDSAWALLGPGAPPQPAAAERPAWDGGVLAAVERHASRTPWKVAVRAGSQSLSYGFLAKRARQYAAALSEQGVRAGDRIGLCMERSSETICAMLGVLRSGAAYVPLDPGWPGERLARMIEASAPRVLVAQAGQRLPSGVPVLALPRRDGPTDPAPAREWPPLLPAYVICTSGTTGAPKPVVVSHGSLAFSTRARAVYYGPSAPRFLLTSPLSFDSSVAGLHWTLSEGGCLVLAPPGAEGDPDALAGLLRRHGISHWLTVPAVYAATMEAARPHDFASVTAVTVAGEACGNALVRRHHGLALPAALYNEYGPTEATVWSTVHRCAPEDGRAAVPVPIGTPIDGATVRVTDGYGQPVPHGVRGELCIGGHGVAEGYLRAPGLTAERFVPDPASRGARMYRSGDVVHAGPQGSLHYAGRRDGQVKIRGFRVECGDVEAALESLQGVEEAVVLPETADGSPARLVAFVRPSRGSVVAAASLRETLAARVPSYMVPARFVVLDRLPVDSNGKVDRRRLAATPAEASAPRLGDVLRQVRGMTREQVERALALHGKGVEP